MELRLDELLILHIGVILRFRRKAHSLILRLFPLASVERNDEVHAVICHGRDQLLVIEDDEDRADIFGISVSQLNSGVNGHTLNIVEDEPSILVHALRNQRQVDFQACVAERPCEIRNLGVRLTCEAHSGHIHDDLHGINEMNNLKVREALEPDSAVQILLLYVAVVPELLEDLSLVLRVELIQFRFLLRSKEVFVSFLQRTVVIPEVFILLIALRMIDSHPFDPFRRVDVCHVRLPCIRIILLVQSQEFIGKLSHVCSGAFHITKTAAHLKALLLHPVADVQDLVCRKSSIGKRLLNGGEGAGQQPALLAKSREVEAAAVFHIAHEGRSAGAGEIVQSGSVLCDHLRNAVHRVDIVHGLLDRYADCLRDFLCRLVALLHIVGFRPCAF